MTHLRGDDISTPGPPCVFIVSKSAWPASRPVATEFTRNQLVPPSTGRRPTRIPAAGALAGELLPERLKSVMKLDRPYLFPL